MSPAAAPDPGFVLGVGARSAVPDGELERAAEAAMGLAGVSVTVLATLDRRADLVRPLADRRGWTLLAFTDAELAGMPTPNVVRLTGAPSVCEAAALRAAGPGATLILPKRTYPGVTVAIAAYDRSRGGR
ncbi:cobalamin biosynthesis protein [Actinoplanes sp. NPDC051494]|uniref:cobalamin biosynthesis protein n=1 Tax=Actinoplanes sp. NPDC051494 TaxID=3363907 RepID=UPI0037A7B47C